MRIWLLAPLCIVTVRVEARPLRARVVNAKHQLVAGAKVLLFDKQRDRKPISQTQSDADGAFSLEVSDDPQAFQTVQIEAANAGVLVDTLYGPLRTTWQVPPATSLSGTVVDEDEAPVANAVVSVNYLLYHRDYGGRVRGVEARTDATGHWTLRGLPEGYSINCLVRAPKKALARFDAFLETSNPAFPPITVQSGFDARGTVRDDKGAPLAGVAVYSTNAGENGDATDEKGAFVLPNLPLQAQNVAVVLDRPDLFAPQTLTVSPLKPTLEVATQRGVPITGRFVDSVTKKPVADVSFTIGDSPADRLMLKPDAQGRFAAMAPTSPAYVSLRVEGENYMHKDEFLDAARIGLGNIGDIELVRGVVWKGHFTLNGAAPGETAFLNAKRKTALPPPDESPAQLAQDGPSPPNFPTIQIQADKNGDFQSAPTYPGEYVFAEDSWKFAAVAPLSVVLPAPSDKAFVQDVAVRKIPQQVVRGRVETPDGLPVPWATVVSADGRATTRADGSWKYERAASDAPPIITGVRVGDTPYNFTPPIANKDGDDWTVPTLNFQDQKRTARVSVFDANDRIARGARVFLLASGTVKSAIVDGAGRATFRVAPGTLTVFGAKDLLFGQGIDEGNGYSITLRPAQPERARPLAEAVLSNQRDISNLVGNWSLLGEARLRKAALVADGALNNPTHASRNYGRFLSALEAYEPKTALAEIPFVAALAVLPKDAPFELRQAEQTLAVLAAKSDNAAAKAWATRYLAQAIKGFAATVELKPEWSGGDQTSRFLALYQLATALKNPIARACLEAAINALPANPSSDVYSYAGYFEIDDPNLRVFREELPLKDRVEFAGACSYAANIETPEQARVGLAEVEKVAAEPEVRAKVPADSIARSLMWARSRTFGLLMNDPDFQLRPFLAQLRAGTGVDTSGYYALDAAQLALKRADKALARDFFGLAVERGWYLHDEDGLNARSKYGALFKALSAAFPDLVPKAPAPPDLDLLRAQALTDLRFGSPTIGNAMPDAGADPRQLRALDPALGRLILEARWARLGPVTGDNGYEARAIAEAMELYDVARALELFATLENGAAAGNERLQIAARVVAGSTPRVAP